METVENKVYVNFANKFINDHNNDDKWSPFDRVETCAIIMYANWLEINKTKIIGES